MTNSVDKGEPRIVAVIDIGSNSVRMVVAQVLPDGRIDVLERMRRPVRLGQDTFLHQQLSQRTSTPRRRSCGIIGAVLDSYHVSQIRAVATAAVREAANADAFLDRVLMAANIEVEVIEPTEEGRLTVHCAVARDGRRRRPSRWRGAGGRHRRRQHAVDPAPAGGDRRLRQLRPGLDPAPGDPGHRAGVAGSRGRSAAAPDRRHGGGDPQLAADRRGGPIHRRRRRRPLCRGAGRQAAADGRLEHDRGQGVRQVRGEMRVAHGGRIGGSTRSRSPTRKRWCRPCWDTRPCSRPRRWGRCWFPTSPCATACCWT